MSTTVPYFHIIFRACDVVQAVNKSPRPFNLDKQELIKICFRSLHESVKHVPHILGDKLSSKLMDFFSGYDVKLSNGSYGNDESIRQSIKLALTLPDDDWVYLCEDDYLHRPETFSFISRLIAEKETMKVPVRKRWSSKVTYINPDLVIFPPDYPDRYLPHDLEQFYIFHSSDCHWRQVANTTFTLMLQVKVIKKYRHVFEKSSIGANDGYLSNTLFAQKEFKDRCLCLSPLAGLSTHMHADTITPLVDWKHLVDLYSAADASIQNQSK